MCVFVSVGGGGRGHYSRGVQGQRTPLWEAQETCYGEGGRGYYGSDVRGDRGHCNVGGDPIREPITTLGDRDPFSLGDGAPISRPCWLVSATLGCQDGGWASKIRIPSHMPTQGELALY